MYKCAICGKEYENIAERAKCEAECLKIQESEKAAKKMAEAKEKREAERVASIEKLRAMKKECEALRTAEEEAHSKYVQKKREYDAAYIEHVDKYVTQHGVTVDVSMIPLSYWFS